jgi:hypothetical protein
MALLLWYIIKCNNISITQNTSGTSYTSLSPRQLEVWAQNYLAVAAVAYNVIVSKGFSETLLQDRVYRDLIPHGQVLKPQLTRSHRLGVLVTFDGT